FLVSKDIRIMSLFLASSRSAMAVFRIFLSIILSHSFISFSICFIANRICMWFFLIRVVVISIGLTSHQQQKEQKTRHNIFIILRRYICHIETSLTLNLV